MKLLTFLMLLPYCLCAMEQNHLEPNYLTHIPRELWSEIFSYVPIDNQFKQLMLAKNRFSLTQEHANIVANEWYIITQKQLLKMHYDNSNDINHKQKNYLQNALSWANSLNTHNKELFSAAIDTVLRQQTDSDITFKQLKNYFVSSRGNLTMGYRIKRISMDIPLTLEQRKLFLIAFNYVNVATINALDPEFPVEQVNGMGIFGNGLLPHKELHAYFEQQASKEKYHYQKIGNFNPLYIHDKKPLSAITNTVSFNHNEEQQNQLVVNMQIKVSSLE